MSASSDPDRVSKSENESEDLDQGMKRPEPKQSQQQMKRRSVGQKELAQLLGDQQGAAGSAARKGPSVRACALWVAPVRCECERPSEGMIMIALQVGPAQNRRGAGAGPSDEVRAT